MPYLTDQQVRRIAAYVYDLKTADLGLTPPFSESSQALQDSYVRDILDVADNKPVADFDADFHLTPRRTEKASSLDNVNYVVEP